MMIDRCFKSLTAWVWLALLVTLSSQVHAASLPSTEAKQNMVVSAQHLAAETGLAILKAGGNAVDAAVAVGYAEAVTNPCCGNLGGGGFMTLHLADGTDHFINFREKAPAAATANMYLDAAGELRKGASLNGYLAVGVPGTVAGMELAHDKYGKLPRAEVMAPAIKLAREGFILTRGDTDILQNATAKFRADPAIAKTFLRPDGSPFEPGDKLVQPELALTLEAIAEKGADAFYKGANARKIAAASAANGGILTEADLNTYDAKETKPLTCAYRGFTITSAPPPSSGGTTICEILNILSGYDLKALGFRSAQSVHLMVEAMRHAYLDRNTLLGDPDFVANPLEKLLSADYASAIRAKIDPDHAMKSSELMPGTEPHERPETTHYSVLDKDGNAVAVTYTINGLFGAGVMAADTGFFLNNEMDDFTTAPGKPNLFGLVQGPRNAIAPGKRPLSSMAPTIVTRDGKPVMVLGSPGGARIITITLETILNLVDYGMELQEAVDSPRFHHQWLPDEVYVETRGFSPDTKAKLENMGYKVTEQGPWGAVAAIAVGQTKPDAAASPAVADMALSGKMRAGFVYGANDSRRPAGRAIGD
jgi:gamma-glutamyltranspeptidase/glutathione hydrolase